MSLRGAKRRSNLTSVKQFARLLRHPPRRIPRNDTQRVGIFGGTFNPIHIGHLKMAEAARKEYQLSVVYFIPCGIPPHKSNAETCRGMFLLPAKLRYEMVKKAIEDKKHFKVLDIEIKKKKPCYTIDTITSLKWINNVKTYFLIGADEFENLKTWKGANNLAKLITFLVLPRPSKNIKVPKIKNLKWHLVHTKPINISSSEIREKLALGKSVRKFMPASLRFSLQELFA